MIKMKKVTALFSAVMMMALTSLTCFAETIGSSSGNADPVTGVPVEWVPAAIGLGVLIVLGVVFGIISAVKKKKNNKEDE